MCKSIVNVLQVPENLNESENQNQIVPFTGKVHRRFIHGKKQQA